MAAWSPGMQDRRTGQKMALVDPKWPACGEDGQPPCYPFLKDVLELIDGRLSTIERIQSETSERLSRLEGYYKGCSDFISRIYGAKWVLAGVAAAGLVIIGALLDHLGDIVTFLVSRAH